MWRQRKHVDNIAVPVHGLHQRVREEAAGGAAAAGFSKGGPGPLPRRGRRVPMVCGLPPAAHADRSAPCYRGDAESSWSMSMKCKEAVSEPP